MTRSLRDEAANLATKLISNEMSGGPSNAEVRETHLAQLRALNDLTANVDGVAESVSRIVDSTCELLRLGIVVRAELERLRIETSHKRERLAKLAPSIFDLLKDISGRIERLVEQSAAIDVSKCPESEIRWRNRLMDLAEKHNETLHSTMMKLLT